MIFGADFNIDISQQCAQGLHRLSAFYRTLGMCGEAITPKDAAGDNKKNIGSV